MAGLVAQRRRIPEFALGFANRTVHGAIAEILASQRGGQINEKPVAGGIRPTARPLLERHPSVRR
jgi:hypothetical protein